MAVIHDDLTIQVAPCSSPAHGLGPSGSIRTSYRCLVSRFGEPDFGRPDATVEQATLWLLDTPGGRVQLHNWLDIQHFLRQPDSEVRWSVQAAGDRVLPWLYKAIAGSTAGFPAGAGPVTRTSSRETLTSAYADYLYLRSRAVANWVNLQPRDSQPYRENWTVPRHLQGFAVQVLEILHHFQWASADPAERRAWASMPKPAAGAELEHWRATSQWQYEPIPTAGGDPDLAGMLRERAKDCTWVRDCVVQPGATGIVRTRKSVLYDEHIATLTALADTAVADMLAGTRR